MSPSARRGGTASMIISSVCNKHRNSDLRADNPDILRALNERFEVLEAQRDELLEALKAARGFCKEFISARYEVDLIDAAIASVEGRK